MTTVSVTDAETAQVFKRGDNIIYTPPEADDNPKLVLHGVVVGMGVGTLRDRVLCRFYFRGTRIWWTPRDSFIPVEPQRLVLRKGWKAK
jgi:hypothetical protein